LAIWRSGLKALVYGAAGNEPKARRRTWRCRRLAVADSLHRGGCVVGRLPLMGIFVALGLLYLAIGARSLANMRRRLQRRWKRAICPWREKKWQ
jgi:hypothetical protein